MKKSFVTEAINLKNYPLSDNDSIVVMFSKTKGLIHAIAKGAKKPKSKLGARIQMFIANKMMLFEGKSMDTIYQAESLNTFSKIRYDFDKLSYSMYVAEIVNNFCSKDYDSSENSGDIYDLIFNTFDKIAKTNKKEDVILSALKFQVKIVALLGWGIDFSFCSICQKNLDDDNNSLLFSNVDKGFICADCKKELEKNDGILIHNKIRMFLKTLYESPFDKKTKYDELVTLSVLEKCFDFMKKYIDSLTNKKTKVFETINTLEKRLVI